MNARPQAWLHQAENDLQMALVAQNHGFFAQACYHASQAAEKALKSLILELGADPLHTHVLGQLLQQLGSLGMDPAPFEALPLRVLTRMSASSRYPIDATPPADLFEQPDAEQAIQIAQAVLAAVAQLDRPEP